MGPRILLEHPNRLFQLEKKSDSKPQYEDHRPEQKELHGHNRKKLVRTLQRKGS